MQREEGFSKLNEKFGEDYDHFEAADDPDSKINKDYYVYRERFYERYWDTKENHEWYSQPVSTRAWITLKKVSEFFADISLLLLLGGAFVVFNARNKAALKHNEK
jgi:hypothetical protein